MASKYFRICAFGEVNICGTGETCVLCTINFHHQNLLQRCSLDSKKRQDPRWVSKIGREVAHITTSKFFVNVNLFHFGENHVMTDHLRIGIGLL